MDEKVLAYETQQWAKMTPEELKEEIGRYTELLTRLEDLMDSNKKKLQVLHELEGVEYVAERINPDETMRMCKNHPDREIFVADVCYECLERSYEDPVEKWPDLCTCLGCYTLMETSLICSSCGKCPECCQCDDYDPESLVLKHDEDTIANLNEAIRLMKREHEHDLKVMQKMLERYCEQRGVHPTRVAMFNLQPWNLRVTLNNLRELDGMKPDSYMGGEE